MCDNVMDHSEEDCAARPARRRLEWTWEDNPECEM